MIERDQAAKANILMAVTGGISAYKSCEVLRGLQNAGCDVRVCMSGAATRFVSPLTFEALSGHPVAVDLFSYPDSAIPHVRLAEWADLTLVCPATADVLGKLAAGIADDCLTSCLVAASSPVLVAPAMNTNMWLNAATQANVDLLDRRGMGFVGPSSGHLACGTTGAGKLAPVDEIVSAALASLGGIAKRDLAGRHVLVTAGPTREAIDPVRFVSNESSGKMGYALARAFLRHGATVSLVSGPCSLEPPAAADLIKVTSASQMLKASIEAFATCDIAVCAAAVADYTPAHPSDHKLKKASEPLDEVELTETADILATLCSTKGSRTVVGFAAETQDVIEHAREKLVSKGCDLVVANDVSRPDSTFGSDTDAVTLVGHHGETSLGCRTKDEVAEAIVERIVELGDAGSC